MSAVSPEKQRARAAWWAGTRALAKPIGLYWMSLLATLGMFAMAIVLTGNDEPRDFMILGVFVVSTMAGVMGGQVVALARIRSVWILTGSVFMSMVMFWVIAEFGNDIERALAPTLGRDAVIASMLGLLLFFMFMSAGTWSLRVNSGALASWGPFLYATGSIIVVTEESGRDSLWHQGWKFAFWDWTTAPILLFATGSFIAFMAAREGHRLHNWSASPRGPEEPVVRQLEHGTLSRFSGCGTVFMLASLIVLLTVDAGIVGPYLWRTGPGDRSGNGGGGDPTEEFRDGNNGDPDEQQTGEGNPLQGMEKVLQQGGQAMKQALAALCTLMTLVILALLGIFAFGPPLRRALLLQHLRRPLWPVTTTQRARLHWRLVEVALGDAGIERKPGDTPRSLLDRARPHLEDLDLGPLERCADIADRVMFGLGIRPEDLDHLNRTSEMTYQGIWDGLGEGEKVRAVYRWL